VRQDFGDERAEQTTGKDAREDPAEQRNIMGQDVEHAGKTVAPPHQCGTDRNQHGDRDHRPADRLSRACRTRFAFGVVRGADLTFESDH
jgi:hypothetical protein